MTAAIISVLLLITPTKVQSNKEVQIVPPDPLTPEQHVWVQALRWCESRGNDNAINKVDRDGTPSYGRFQFKPSTYEYLSKRYGLASTTDYMNGEQQQTIVEHMLLDPKITDNELRTRQFPDCISRKIGLPARPQIWEKKKDPYMQDLTLEEIKAIMDSQELSTTTQK